MGTLEVFDNDGLLNATSWFGGVKQNLLRSISRPCR